MSIADLLNAPQDVPLGCRSARLRRRGQEGHARPDPDLIMDAAWGGSSVGCPKAASSGEPGHHAGGACGEINLLRGRLDVAQAGRGARLGVGACATHAVHPPRTSINGSTPECARLTSWCGRAVGPPQNRGPGRRPCTVTGAGRSSMPRQGAPSAILPWVARLPSERSGANGDRPLRICHQARLTKPTTANATVRQVGRVNMPERSAKSTVSAPGVAQSAIHRSAVHRGLGILQVGHHAKLMILVSSPATRPRQSQWRPSPPRHGPPSGARPHCPLKKPAVDDLNEAAFSCSTSASRLTWKGREPDGLPSSTHACRRAVATMQRTAWLDGDSLALQGISGSEMQPALFPLPTRR
ncbi:hypothetical protein PCL_01577 [Purpureocillium lilacinum]|uniref:Uncharacterized protein n=1 Tax=Purpureocillium lilacinum TaxID=33203 RepID=A0A2U3DNZ5_PURLI|nr:hypothetical protein PCL_01577 [Purpureocillium lilacinum]